MRDALLLRVSEVPLRTSFLWVEGGGRQCPNQVPSAHAQHVLQPKGVVEESDRCDQCHTLTSNRNASQPGAVSVCRQLSSTSIMPTKRFVFRHAAGYISEEDGTSVFACGWRISSWRMFQKGCCQGSGVGEGCPFLHGSASCVSVPRALVNCIVWAPDGGLGGPAPVSIVPK